MGIPWKRWGGRLAEWAVTLIRATAPDKGQADPPREPTSTEAFDRWKDGAKVLLAALVLSAGTLAAQAPDSACVAAAAVNLDTLARLQLPGAELYPTQRRSRERLIDVARARCTPVRPDTVRVVVTDTILQLRVDTVLVVRTDTVVVPPTDTSVPPIDTIVSPPRDSVPPDSAFVPPDTTTPPDTTPPPLPPPSSGVAELPRAIPVVPAGLDDAPCTVSVVASSLQSAVNQSRAGDVLCLAPGAVSRGTLTLPDRPDTGWVVVRTAPAPGQPSPGERVRPSQRASLATIEAQGSSAGVLAAAGAHGWYLAALEVTTDSTISTWTNALIDLPTPSTQADFARDIVFDRVWAHGWAHRPLRRCLSMQSMSTTVRESWLDECHEKGADSQAIVGWAGPGPYLITGNYLAGAGENVMFGGADPRFPGVHPSDITITRNHVHTPISWRGVWTKKNLLELKNSDRVLIEGNVFDGSWGDGQTGYAVVLKSTNQGGTNAHRDQSTRNVTFWRNLIVRSAAALNLNGKGGNVNTDSVTRRVLIAENYADSLCEISCDTRGVMLLSGARDAVFRRNTWLAPPATVNSYSGGSAGGITARNLTIDGDLLTRGKYQLMGCWTAACTPGLSFRAALIGSGPVPSLITAQFPTLDSALAAGFGISRSTIDAAVAGVVVHP